MIWMEEFYNPGHQAVWEEENYIYIVRKNPRPIPNAIELVLVDPHHKSKQKTPIFCDKPPYKGNGRGTIRSDMGDLLWSRSYHWHNALWARILEDPLPWFMEGML